MTPERRKEIKDWFGQHEKTPRCRPHCRECAIKECLKKIDRLEDILKRDCAAEIGRLEKDLAAEKNRVEQLKEENRKLRKERDDFAKLCEKWARFAEDTNDELLKIRTINDNCECTGHYLCRDHAPAFFAEEES